MTAREQCVEELRKWRECPWESREARDAMRFWFAYNRGPFKFFKRRRARKGMVAKGWPEEIVRAM